MSEKHLNEFLRICAEILLEMSQEEKLEPKEVLGLFANMVGLAMAFQKPDELTPRDAVKLVLDAVKAGTQEALDIVGKETNDAA